MNSTTNPTETAVNPFTLAPMMFEEPLGQSLMPSWGINPVQHSERTAGKASKAATKKKAKPAKKKPTKTKK